MSEENQDSPIKSRTTWMRGLYMLLFTFIIQLVEVVLVVVILLQFLIKLFTGKLNRRMQILGQRLSTYAYEILHYLTFNRDSRPYPFDRWPMGEPKPTKRSDRPAAESKAPEQPVADPADATFESIESDDESADHK